jgi:ABC-2 type transport system ATP-binding protein
VDASPAGWAPGSHAGWAPGSHAGWAIECEGLSRDFGDVRAVDRLDLTVPRGAVFGFLGPNGAGKTTTIRLMLGLLPPTAGRVRVLGHELPGGAEDVRRRAGAVLEQQGFYEGLSMRTNLELHARAYGLSHRESAQRVSEVGEQFGLASRLDDRPAQLSRGMRQRLAVARALLGRPDLLVLDEPTNGLDATAAAELRDTILALAGGGTTVFLATHLLSEAERLCDLVAVVKGGRVVASGTPGELRRRMGVSRVRIEGPGVAAAAGSLLEGASPDGPDAVVVSVDGLAGVAAAVEQLVHAGVALHRVDPQGQTLEAAFLSLIAGGAAVAEPHAVEGLTG